MADRARAAAKGFGLAWNLADHITDDLAKVLADAVAQHGPSWAEADEEAMPNPCLLGCGHYRESDDAAISWPGLLLLFACVLPIVLACAVSAAWERITGWRR